MSIAQTIKQNKKIQERNPISLTELVEHVNSFFTKNKKTRTAVRNIFIGNNDYYNFKYTTIAWGKYGPLELNSPQKVIKKIVGDKLHKRSGISLAYEMGLSTQNPFVETWYIFGKPKAEEITFLNFYKDSFTYKFIDIDKKLIKDCMFLMELEILRWNDLELKKYIIKNNISQNKLINAYKVLLSNTSKETEDTNLNIWDEFLDTSKLIEKTILKGIIYAKK